jgi:toxin ParE1/3/4
MVKIVWTVLALEDLRSIYDYISRDSKVYAERVVDKIILRADQLANFPNSGRVVPEFEDVTIRELIQGNYRIIYKTSATQASIIRIHHSARILK